MRERQKRTLEQQEHEAEKKRKFANEPGIPVHEIDFASHEVDVALSTKAETCTEERATQTGTFDDANYQDADTQTDELEYLFKRGSYQAPDEDYFDTDEKVRFYTGLPSSYLLKTVVDHVALHVTRMSFSLNNFQEFVLVLIKLRLDVPLKDLAFRFNISLSTASRMFSFWIVVMDIRLSPLISWPDREKLWNTMPMCFQYAFGKKVTVIINCFEIL